MKKGSKRFTDKGYTYPMQVVEQARTIDKALLDESDGKHYLLRFESPVAVIDHANGNKHYFSKKLYDSQIFKNAEVNGRLVNGHVNGQLGHPMGDDARLEENISHVFDELYPQKRDEDGLTYAWSKGRVLDTPKGRTLYALYKGGVNMGFSVCGMGDSEIRDGVEFLDADYFYLEGYDAVSTPSVGVAVPISLIDNKVKKDVLDSIKDEKIRKEVERVLDNFVSKEHSDMKDSIDAGVVAGIKAEFAGSEIEQTFELFRLWLEKQYPHYIDVADELWAGQTEIQDADKDKDKDKDLSDEEKKKKKEEEDKKKKEKEKKDSISMDEDNATKVIAGLTKENYSLLSDNQKKDERIGELEKALQDSVMKIALKDRIVKDNVKAGIELKKRLDSVNKEKVLMGREISSFKDKVEDLQGEVSSKDGLIKKLELKIKDSKTKVVDHLKRGRELVGKDSKIDGLKFQIRIKDILLKLPVSQRAVAETLFADCRNDGDVDRVLDHVQKRSIIEPTVFNDEIGDGVREQNGTTEDNLTGFIMSRMSRNNRNG